MQHRKAIALFCIITTILTALTAPVCATSNVELMSETVALNTYINDADNGIRSNILSSVEGNIFTNGGLESGSTQPFVTSGKSNYRGIEISDEAYSGNYSLLTHPRPNSTDRYYQTVSLEANTTYILSAMVKSAVASEFQNFEGYIWSGTATRPYRQDEFVTITPQQWKRVTLTLVTSSAGNYDLGFLAFLNSGNLSAYVDDHYVGKLLISDIDTADIEPVMLPKGNEKVVVPILNGGALNQFGESKGLTEEEIVIDLPDVPGLTLDGNNLIIDSSASLGTYTIKVSCTPSYAGATQQAFTKNLQLQILSQPKASDVKVSGRAIPGEILTADYLYDFDTEEGASVYEWLVCDTPNGEFTVIENADFKELEITEELLNKYIKFAVTPVDITGVSGNREESNMIAPEQPPEVTDVICTTDTPYTNSYVGVTYEFYDANGDADTKTDIVWYVSDNGTDNWSDVGNGKNLHITNDFLSKYIKCVVTPKTDAANFPSGTPVESNVIGPVGDIYSESNIFVNGGLESGALEPFVASGGANYKGIELSDEAYSGSHSVLTHPRPNSTDRYYQTVSLEGNTTYILSAMVKAGSNGAFQGFEGYIWTGTATRPYRQEEYVTISPEWKRVTLTFVTSSAGNYDLGFLTFTNSGNVSAYIDDHYVGKLLVSDIDTADIEPVIIPQGNEIIEVPILNGGALNQFGESKGLIDEEIVIDIHDAPGITLDGNKLIIDSRATVGTYPIEVSCTASYAGATQPGITKYLELELLSHNDTAPKALDVNATGEVSVGSTLTGSYEFYQVDRKSNASTVRWIYSESENGVYYDIPGATSDTYVVDSTYADKYIKFVVTPKTSDGLVGKEVASYVLAADTAPIAKNVNISGDYKIGGVVNAQYDFYDINRDEENGSTYQWYISDVKEGSYTTIPGENTTSLTITSDMVDKYIKFGVTPVSNAVPATGTEVFSDSYVAATAPVAKNVYIQNVNGELTGNYTYYHKYNARELDSLYSWTVDGVTVSTKQSYVPNFFGTKTVSFTVTPVGNTDPSIGKPVTATITLSGKSPSTLGTSGGFAGGGSGGGSGGSADVVGGVTSINDKNYVEETKQTEDESKPLKSDIVGHWGEEYINTMVSRGVMSSDENGNYNPDEFVSREDMLTFLFKTLRFEKSEYSGMFGDVTDAEFGGMLQTMVDNGTISKDTQFRPGDSISREEMCKILYISLENAGKLEVVEEGLINGLSDYSDISDWAVKYVNAMYGIKMMIGVSDERFAPKENVTKAQAATMLTRIISLVEEE